MLFLERVGRLYKISRANVRAKARCPVETWRPGGPARTLMGERRPEWVCGNDAENYVEGGRFQPRICGYRLPRVLYHVTLLS
jgi:hypothetical protein